MRARPQEDGKPEAVPDTVARDVATAQATGKLDEVFVDAVANADQRDSVVQALSALARVPKATVRKAFQSRSAKPVTAFVWHGKLSMRVALKIQSLVMKLTRGELLPARAKVHFPMTEDQMRWHLGYFDIVV